ncbi:hypothetical protein [Massilia sp. METH4]|uniref:hypothetical protein n=1 Tax=Massilia sp. METH4 TaxID=3123041 RepID=UPI0030CBFF9F
MMTDPQFAAWLASSDAIRCMLFEVGSSAGTRYLSTLAYRNAPPETPYQAVVAGGLRITESIAMDADASLSAGDIEIHNADGARDAWLDDVWTNQPVAAFLGDIRWPREDFRQVFAGVVIDIGCKSRDRLNLRLANQMERLNSPVTDTKIGGNAPSPDSLVPVLLGEGHNIEPVLTNPNTLEYAFGLPGAEELKEVRVDGKPRAVTTSLAAGRFTFSANVMDGAQVTCSAQGVKLGGAYVNTVAKLVEYLVTQCGKAATRFTAADLDAAQLAAFNTANPQPVGLYLRERTNVLVAAQQLAASVGAQLVPSMAGKLRLIQFAMPSSAGIEIPPAQQIDRSIQIVKRSEVAAAVKIGYCRNWTVQENMQTSVWPAHKALYAQEWLTVTAEDAAVKAAYKLDAEPVQVDTCLLRKTDAEAEAARRLAIVKQPRTTYRFEAAPAQLLTELGAAVRLYSNRFGLAASKVGLVTSRSVDWGTLRITMEVTV